MSIQNVSESHRFLTEAESWCVSVVEERVSEVLEAAGIVLAGSDTSPHVRLDCLKLIADKLVEHVAVYEKEDLVLKPFVHSALQYIGEIITAATESTEEERVILIPLVTRVLHYTRKVMELSIHLQISSISFIYRRWPKLVENTLTQALERFPLC